MIKTLYFSLYKGHNIGKIVDLNTVFTKLKYLSLRNVVFTNASLLQSAELEHLMLEHSFFHIFEKCNAHPKEIGQIDLSDCSRSPSIFKYQFNDLKSRKIKYLSLDYVEFEFVHHCVRRDLFNSLEEIDFTFVEFFSLIFLAKCCPSLKKVNCRVGVDDESFLRGVRKIEYASKRLINRLSRDDLSVYLFGM